MPELVITEYKDQVFEIRLNRPEKHNAINWPMMAALGGAIDLAEKAQGARAVLIYGEGRVFSSGLDLVAFPEVAEYFGENWRENMMPVTEAFQAVLTKVERCSLPTIALLRGFALGLGMEHTRMALPETLLGLIPDVGGSTRLTRLIGPARAKELIFTGRMVNLELAEKWGLLNAVVPAKELYDEGKKLAAEIAKAAPLAVSCAKRVINGLADIDHGLQLEALAQNQLIQTDDFKNGIQAMIAKTEPAWSGK